MPYSKEVLLMLDVLSALAALATVGTFLSEFFDRIRIGKRAANDWQKG